MLLRRRDPWASGGGHSHLRLLLEYFSELKLERTLNAGSGRYQVRVKSFLLGDKVCWGMAHRYAGKNTALT